MRRFIGAQGLAYGKLPIQDCQIRIRCVGACRKPLRNTPPKFVFGRIERKNGERNVKTFRQIMKAVSLCTPQKSRIDNDALTRTKQQVGQFVKSVIYAG